MDHQTARRLWTADAGGPATFSNAPRALGDPVWLGYAAWLRGNATGQLDRAAQDRRSVTAAEALIDQLDSRDVEMS